MTISRWIILRIRNVLDKIVDKIKTHILCSQTFFRKTWRLWNNVEKYDGAREATDGNKIWRMRVACWISKAAHAHVHAHAHVPRHPPPPTHSELCNNYCFFTATVVSRMRLIVTLYVHCIYCCFIALLFVSPLMQAVIRLIVQKYT
jgi:hypothetical protein